MASFGHKISGHDQAPKNTPASSVIADCHACLNRITADAMVINKN